MWVTLPGVLRLHSPSPGLKEAGVTVTWPPWRPAYSGPLWCSQQLPISESENTAEASLGGSLFPCQDLLSMWFSEDIEKNCSQITHSFGCRFQNSIFDIPEYLYIQILCRAELLILLITENRLIFHISTCKDTKVVSCQVVDESCPVLLSTQVPSAAR